MDTRRRNSQKAQNYASRVCLLKKNRFLGDISESALRIDSRAYVPRIVKWERLQGFRMNAGEDRTRAVLEQAAVRWARAAAGEGFSSVFAMVWQEGTFEVLYGAGREDAGRIFQAGIPECDLQPAQWKAARYPYNGILTGTLKAKGLSDSLADSGIKNGYVACILVPLADEEVQDKLAENRRLLAFLNGYQTVRRVHGNASRWVEEIPVGEIVEAIALLKEETEYLEGNAGQGFVRSAVRFGAETAEEYEALIRSIRSGMEFDGDLQGGFEPLRCFRLPNACETWRDCFAIPCVEVAGRPDIGRVYAVSVQDLKSAAAFCVPPLNSYAGYYVKNYNISEDAREAFPLVQGSKNAGAALGKLRNGAKAAVPFSALHCHALVTGATKTGKTTTVKKMLLELYAAGIPFTVIEAAKKEYVSLLGAVPELMIYTPGADGLPLAFNPLQPENGVLIENHAAAVARALTAATGGDHPIPEAYEGLLKQTYQQFGWEYGTMAYPDELRPFPTFRDVLDNIPRYIAEHAQYGPEVRQNLTAALTLRTEMMASGALGRLFAENWGLTAADLLESPCVIELSDFSIQAVEILMNLLLFKFQSYLSRQPECGNLKRVIVVEEAHNVFRKTDSEDSGRALNNDYFDKMLAEIRSSGAGLILSDQRPSILSDAVLANTSVKIIHGLTANVDREAVGLSCGLSKFQTKKLREFQAGECLAAVRGSHGVQHILVDAAGTGREFHAACTVCSNRFRCRRTAVKALLEKLDARKAAFHISKIQANPYNIPQLEGSISNMLQDFRIVAADATKLCLLGEILQTYGTSSFQENRIIVTAYAGYLQRRRIS